MAAAQVTYIYSQYYTIPERRHSICPRREKPHTDRRYRNRTESLISNFRSDALRRKEDDEGFYEISNLYLFNDD